MAGSMVFFVIAGVLAGLTFRQNEQERYDVVITRPPGTPSEVDPFQMPPPMTRGDTKDWPESLP